MKLIIQLFYRNANTKTSRRLEAYYTTGSYALILKVMTQDISKFQLFLMDKLQGIAEIQSTESFVCLSLPISRVPKLF